MNKFYIHYCNEVKEVEVGFGNGLFTSAYTIGYNGGSLVVRYGGCLSAVTAHTALTFTIDDTNKEITFTVPANLSYGEITYNFTAYFCDGEHADAIITQGAYAEVDYLRFKSLSNDCKYKINAEVQYSTDGALTWTTLAANTWTPTVPNGSTILWRGNLSATTNNGIGTFTANTSNYFEAKGNPLSLVSGDSFEEVSTLDEYQFCKLFDRCYSLTKADELVLTATTLAKACYANMFQDCTSLTTAPQLPATTLAIDCYYGMFADCTSLTTAPQLPATTLAGACYYGMFQSCWSLTTVPQLPATTLAQGCYRTMFGFCSGLTTAQSVLPATTLADECYKDMFQYCTSLTTAPVISATTLAPYCCERMFYTCSGLTTAPVLSAETEVENCYQKMFYYCSNLNSVTCLAVNDTIINANNWLYGVAAGGTFTKKREAYFYRNNSGIPIGWNVIEVD